MLSGGMQDWPLRITAILDHAARVHGRREIVTRTVEGPIHRTDYARLAGRARQCASALARLGAKPGDRIGTLAWNTHRHLELWYGAGGIGAVYHTINPRLFAEQIRYIIEDADDRLIFTDLTFLPELEKRRDDCLKGRRIVALTDAAHMPDSPLDLLCYEDLIAREPADYPWHDVPESAPVGLCYTSGTTGAPKGVVYTHRSNVLHALMIYGQDGLALGSNSVVLPIVPMYHANAWALAFTAPMVGAKLVLPGAGMDGASLCDLIAQEDVTFAAGVPTVWITVLDELRRRGVAPESVRRIMTGGAACPAWIIDAYAREFGIEIVHAWGMTEMSPVGSIATPRPGMETLDPEDLMRLRLKQGAPFFGVEMRIVDDQGRDLPWDGASAGALRVKGPCVAGAYFRGAGGGILDEQGYFDTGDLATVDSYGFIQITDRTKDVIKSGGEWISPVELENQAACHPEIMEAAAIGIPDDRWGERPLLLAVRTVDGTVGEAELLDFLRPKVARWWLPEAILFLEEMPHTATGKINKLALRALYRDFRCSEAKK